MHTIKIYDIDTTGFKGSGAREAAFLQVIEQFGITAMNTAMRCVMVPVMKTVFEVSDILEHDEQEVYEVTGKELGIGADEVRRRLEHIVDKMWINCDAEYFYEIYLFSQNIREPEVGDMFVGTVVRTIAIGAFVEFAPGKDGLIHISKLSNKRVEKVEDVVNIGDTVKVEIIRIGDKGIDLKLLEKLS